MVVDTTSIVTPAATQTLTNKTLTTPIITNAVNTLPSSSASYTLALSDGAGIVLTTSGSANTVYIPTNLVQFPIGTTITIIQTTSAGQVTIQALTPGTTSILSGASTPSTPKLRTSFSSASVVKISAELWYVVGDVI